MSSIFSLQCASCAQQLSPEHGWQWVCASCGRHYEVCGAYLVEVAARVPTDTDVRGVPAGGPDRTRGREPTPAG